MEEESKIIIILGRRKAGKTYKAKEILNTWRWDYIVWDFLGDKEYTQGTIINNINTFYNWIEDILKAGKKIKIRLRLNRKYFDQICTIVKDLGIDLGQFLFLIEEVDAVTKANYCPESLDWLIQYGRHYGVSLITTSRRPARIPRLLTSQGDILYLFQIKEPIDIKYLEEYASINPEEVQNLSREKHQCLKIDL